MSQELEHRLHRTFIDDDKAVEFYGSQQTAAVVKLIGATIQSTTARDSMKRKHDWLKEQWLFDDVMTAIEYVLLLFRPEGDSGRGHITLSSGTDRADELIHEIRSADPALPITKGSTRQHALAMLKDKLGGLVRDRHPYDEWRKKARPVRIVGPNSAKRKDK